MPARDQPAETGQHPLEPIQAGVVRELRPAGTGPPLERDKGSGGQHAVRPPTEHAWYAVESEASEFLTRDRATQQQLVASAAWNRNTLSAVRIASLTRPDALAWSTRLAPSTSSSTAPGTPGQLDLNPELVAALVNEYEAWAERCGAIPRAQVLELDRRRGYGLPAE
ncbi:hypothetical protein ABN028_33365 [Actinopolymorpha sp. B17G11]|uniref:hypothetical protein n=1 Tax=Actinopolymorpha sp. B17G11 TaxID=3160861 RepID=UPI0032E4AFCD